MESRDLREFSECEFCGGLFRTDKMKVVNSELVSDGPYGMEYDNTYKCIHCKNKS